MTGLFSDNRGQAFSTFQLLISAIVAIIILTFLLGILGFIPSIGATNDPVQTAASEIKQAMQSPGQHYKSTEVLFEAGTYISSKDIAAQAKVGLAPDQICITLDEELKNTDDAWGQGSSDDGGTFIQNLRNLELTNPFSTICGPSNEMEGILGRYDDAPVGLKFSGCEEVITDSPKRVCVLVVRNN